MRYIKRFNENNNEEDLQDFCETHLAYLLDDEDFTLLVDDINDDDDTGHSIRLENYKGFKWNDIKDYFIPFLKQLDKIRGHQIKIDNDKKVFVSIASVGKPKIWSKLNFDDLINDEVKNQRRLWYKIHIELRDE